MQRQVVMLLVLAALSIGIPTQSHGRPTQDQKLYQQIFGKAQEKLGQAKTAQADILSPKLFSKAFEKFGEAREDFKKGRSLKDIDKKLRQVISNLDQAMKTAEVGKVALASCLQARDDALKANAPQYSPTKYKSADEKFTAAARKLEDGDMNSAQSRAREAERLFREAELHAIKTSIIGSVRDQIEQARSVKVNRLAPTTFGKAQALLAEAENTLNTNRYAAGTAREKAEAAEYEIRHAKKLAEQIQRVKIDERAWEKQFLALEQKISEISKTLDFEPRFDEGFDKPVNDIRQAVESLREDRRSLSDEVKQLRAQAEELNNELNSIREAQAGLESQLEKEKRQRQEQQRRQARFKAVENMFTESQARVIREGNDIRIRLVGLSFQSGRSVILPEHFSLLTKLQRAIREFPNATVSIEGHTDSVGDDGYNQRLSTERAMAVREYLLANMGIPEEKIQAVGFGESAPIASNETAAGRSQNRRIDIVIMPQQ